MMSTIHPLVDQYLSDLARLAHDLPNGQGDELVAEIREHLAEGLSPDAGEAEVRNALDRLGPPAQIVAAARADLPAAVPPPPPPPAARRPVRGLREAAAVVLLVTGLPPVIGWLVGLVLLLASPLWTARQKLLGALVWPGGLVTGFFGALFVGLSSGSPESVCTGTPVPVGAVTSTTANCVTTGGDGGLSILGVLGVAVLLLAPVAVGIYLYRAAGRAGAGAAAAS